MSIWREKKPVSGDLSNDMRAGAVAKFVQDSGGGLASFVTAVTDKTRLDRVYCRDAQAVAVIVSL
jgi:hypothetical protein